MKSKISFASTAIFVLVFAVINLFGTLTSYFYYLYDSAGNRIERIYVDDPSEKKSVETTPFTAKVSLTPNPAIDHIKIKIDNINQYKTTKITLYDIQGRVLETKSNVTDETLFNLTEKNSGAYYVRVILDETSRNFKIIKIQ